MEGDKDKEELLLLPLETLPVEVAQHVLGFLEPMDLLRASQVCAGWRQLAADEWVWERVHRLTFGGPPTVPKFRQRKAAPAQQDAELERRAEYEARGKTWRGACLITAHAADASSSGDARLNWACASGHHRLLARDLLERGKGGGQQLAPPSAAVLAKLLVLATSSDHEQVARVLLRHGADPSVRNSKGASCVDRAGNLGRLGILELFLERGYIADPSKVLVQLQRYRNVHGSLVHQAAKQGHLRFMELLLLSAAAGAGGDVGGGGARRAVLNAVDSRGWAPLHYAVRHGHAEMVDLLLRHGADVNQLIENALQTPITLAITHGGDRFIDVVRALVKHHARLDPLQHVGGVEIQGAIHVACATGSLEVVSLLLENGADINARLANGRTPLMVALKQALCELRTIERLVDEFGADLTAEDTRGDNAWHYLCYGQPSDDKAALIEWLHARGLPMRDVSPLFSLLSHIAHHHPQENADTSRVLAAMWRVVGPRLDSSQRHRACLEAARCHRTILAQLFAAPTASPTDGGTDVHSTPQVAIDQETATRVLARIVTRGYINGYMWRDPFALDNVEYLVQQGADVNARVSGRDADPEGQSDDEYVKPICFGVSWFDFKMLHLLQALGADLRARNAMGDTLLAYYLRPTTTACPATTVPSNDPVSDSRTMALFMSWLAHIVKRRGVDGSLRGIYLDLDRPEYHRWPAWAKTLVRDWITNPERDEFDWEADEVAFRWPHIVITLARRTHEPLW